MPDFPIIHGASIVAQTRVEISPGEPLAYHWEGHGFEVHIPAGAISSESGPVTLSIQASLSGDYQLPDDRVLVSGVYWLALQPPVKLFKKVTITIQHCAFVSDGDSKLAFITAKCTQAKLPYTFQPLSQGTFSAPDTGSIQVNHFSGFGAVGEKNSTLYAFRTYYIHERPNIYQAHISVTKNLKLILKVH